MGPLPPTLANGGHQCSFTFELMDVSSIQFLATALFCRMAITKLSRSLLLAGNMTSGR